MPSLLRRNLTILHIKSDHIKHLPPLPPQLKQLHVTFCSNLCELPELPPTLLHLDCWACQALEALPSSLTATAVTKLLCGGCSFRTLPQLPPSLIKLQAGGCRGLLQLPALPEGLKILHTIYCESLTAVSRSC